MILPTDDATQRRNYALLEAELHRLTSDAAPLDDDFAMTSADSFELGSSDPSQPFLRPYLSPLATTLPSLDDYIDDDFLSCQVNHAGDRVASMSCFMPWNVTTPPPLMVPSSPPMSSSSSMTYSPKSAGPSSAFVPSTTQNAAISAAAATAARILKTQDTLCPDPELPAHPIVLTYSPPRSPEPKRPRSPSQSVQPFDTNSVPGSPVSSADRDQSFASAQDVDYALYDENEQADEENCDEEDDDFEQDTSDEEPVDDVGYDPQEQAGPVTATAPVPYASAGMEVTTNGDGISAACFSTMDVRIQLGDVLSNQTTSKVAAPVSCTVTRAENQGAVSPRAQPQRARGGKGMSKDESVSSVRQRRAEAMERFRKKKAMRRYGRRVRYQIRKRIATTRPRVNGRFARRSDVGAVIAVPSPTLGSSCDLTAHVSASDECDTATNRIML